MRSLKKRAIVCGYLATSLIVLHIVSFEALAADSAGDWRPVFDLVMRWVNFLILAFLLIKFSRAPIKSFLESKKEEIASEIKELESAKEQILLEIDENRKQIENSKERLSRLKESIITQGEKNKLKIIEDAELESKMLLESAEQKINHRIAEARETIKLELIDLAMALAIQKLPEQITEQDNQKFINSFLESAASR